MASADVGLVIVAAGSGTRLGAVTPKAFVPLAGVPILEHALRGALSCPDLCEVVIVGPRGWLAQTEEVCRSVGFAAPAESASSGRFASEGRLASEGRFASEGRLASKGRLASEGRLASKDPDVQVSVVAGGPERGDSVAAGLAALSSDVKVVLVHDAARCLAPPEVFVRVVEAIRLGAAAVVPGLRVVDTVKEVDEAGHVVGTPDRSRLRAIQTPQGFARSVLERAHAVTSDATDDAALVERLGEQVLVVEGDERALKITTGDDLGRAARILAG